MTRKTQTTTFGSVVRESHNSKKFYSSKLYQNFKIPKKIEFRENKINKSDLNKLYCKSSENMDEIPDDWASYAVQEAAGKDGSPTEATIRVIAEQKNRDLVIADDDLKEKLPEIIKRGLQKKGLACDTVTYEEYKKMNDEEFEM